MKRLVRSLFAFMAAQSLLLCLLVSCMWARSFSAGLTLTVETTGRLYECRCQNGGVELEVVRDWPGFSALGIGRGLDFGTAGPARNVFGVVVIRGRTLVYEMYSPQSDNIVVTGGSWTMMPTPGSRPVPTSLLIAVPFRHFVVLLSVLPAAWLVRAGYVARRARRRRTGMCSRCGYDLRASEGRCPECGLPIPARGPSPQHSETLKADSGPDR